MIFRELIRRFVYGSSFFIVATLCCGQAIADVIPDGSLGLESSVVLPDVLIRGDLADEIQGGAARGNSLFHSFSDFSISNGQRVYFANPSAINQIFTRVTGSTASDIFGTLGVNGAADLYFINPNGIYFGDTAYLDIAGSFVGATTNNIPFADGFIFDTDGNSIPANPLLTVSQPLGLAAWTTPEADITNRAQLVTGSDLTLFGKSLDLEGSLWSGGELTLLATDTLQIRDRLDVPFTTLSVSEQRLEAETIDIFALSHPDSGLSAYGDLVLRSPNPIIIDAYFNSLGNFRLENTNGLAGDALSPNDPVIRASGDVTFGTYTGASLHVFAGGKVQTGAITINAADGTNGLQETVTLSDGLTTINVDGQNVATLDIRAGTNSFATDSVTGLILPTPPFTNPCISGSPICFGAFPPLPGVSVLQGFATTPLSGRADITIDSLSFTNGGIANFAFISNQYDPNTGLAAGEINLGNISLNTSGDRALVVDSRGDINLTGQVAPLTAGLDVGEILLRAGGEVSVENLLENVGDISIYADTLTAKDGNQIKASTSNASNAGNIFVKANRVEFTGTDSNGVFSGLSSIAAAGSTGNAGMITVEAGSLSLSDGAQLRTSTLGAGSAGLIKVTANGAIAIDGGKIIDTPSGQEPAPSGIVSEVAQGSTGNGQLIEITSKNLTVTNGGIISSATAGAGNAGEIKVSVAETASFSGNPGAPLFPSGVFTQVIAGSAGDGGNLVFKAADLSLTDGAEFRSSTASGGKAGGIAVNIAKNLAIAGNGSGLFANAEAGSTGAGGSIVTTSQNLSVTAGGRISSDTSGAGNAGRVEIGVNQLAQFDGRSPQTNAPSGVFVSSLAGAGGAGGNLQVKAADLTITNGARLEALTEGSQNAGNVKIDVNNDVTVSGEGSGVFANTAIASSGDGGLIDIDPVFIRLSDGGGFFVTALGSGKAGDINVVGDFLILDRGIIQAESTSGLGGNITLNIGEYILLQKASQITATAGVSGGGGDGGNIAINTPFIIAFPNQDNNITANAFTGAGGNINVATNALFGISFADQNTPINNDITVSSELGLDGRFIISTPDVDPTSSLAKLSAGLNDPNNKVVQACSSEEVNSYTVTGRGGLAADPSSTVRGNNLLPDLRDFSELSGEVTEDLPTEAATTPQQIQQATNFVVGEQGIELVASRTVDHHESIASNCR